MKDVLIVGGNYQYTNLFKRLGHNIADDIGSASLIVFTGGEDVTPSFYGDAAHPQTYNSVQRDVYEQAIFNDALDRGIPMVGICRGGQFLNVMNGGRMYQHVTEHTRSHSITDLETGETIYVSSTHHQMMMPSSMAVLVATSNLAGNREWYEGEVFKRDVSEQDIEVVFYPATSSLCFQPHPEFEGYEDMYEYFKSLLSRYLNVA